METSKLGKRPLHLLPPPTKPPNEASGAADLAGDLPRNERYAVSINCLVTGATGAGIAASPSKVRFRFARANRLCANRLGGNGSRRFWSHLWSGWEARGWGRERNGWLVRFKLYGTKLYGTKLNVQLCGEGHGATAAPPQLELNYQFIWFAVVAIEASTSWRRQLKKTTI